MTSKPPNPSSSGLAYPDNNPKTLTGITKVPHFLVPPSAEHYLALAFADGGAKYGPYNWRDRPVSSSIYVSAAKRHINAWIDGEENSEDANVPHLAHAMACCAILLDAASVGSLNDDRPTKGVVSQLQRNYAATSNKEPAIERDSKDSKDIHTSRRTEAEPITGGTTGGRYADTMVNGRLSNIQADVLKAAAIRKFLLAAALHPVYGRVEGYDQPCFDSYRYPTTSGLHSEREEAPSEVHARAEGNCGGPLPVADGDGYCQPTWATELAKLRLHYNQRAGEAVHVGDGCLDVGGGGWGQPPT